ncbi:MAG: LuxR C-terminal-related transcriptional regulator, partial [Trebonia sp.]
PLGPAEVAAVAAGVLGGPPGPHLAELLAWAGGNPRYARELAAGLADAGQIRIQDGVAELTGPLEPARPLSAWLPGAATVAAERLADLDAEVTGALRWAAILGAEFSATDLAVVTASPAERLMEIVGDALAAGLIEDADDGLRFRHDLIRRVLYEQTPAALRGSLHEQAARGLAAAGAPPERIAAQLLAALAPGIQPWAQDWVTRNAPVLARRSPHAAAELTGSVLPGLTPGDPRHHQLRQAMLTALSLDGRDDDVERVGGEMLAAAPDPDLSLLIGYSLVRAGRAADAAGILRRARSVPAPSPVQAARLGALNANVLVLLDFARNNRLHNDSAPSGEATHDGALGEAQAALAVPGADPLASGLAYHARGLLSYLDRDSHARLEHIDRGLAAVGNDTRFADLRLLLLAGRVNALDVLDRRAEAVAAADLTGLAGAPREALVRLMLARAHYTYGSWDDAMTQIGLVTEAAGPDGAGWHAAALAALIAGHRGEAESAAAHLDNVSGQGDRISLADLSGRPDALMARALAAELRTGPASALAVLAECLEPGVVKAAPMRLTLLPDLARLAVTAGDSGLARAAAAAAAREARRDPLKWKLAVADHCAGLAAGDAKAVLAAAEYARSAGRILSCGRALEDAAVLVASGAGGAGAGGDAAAARRLAADAVRQYTRLGARWDIRRVTERLRDRGVRLTSRSYASRSGAGHPAFEGAGLTRTEDRIATLIAQGLSNPEIAARLSVSRNTVQTHVSHILAKLGTRSRGDIIRLTGQHPG